MKIKYEESVVLKRGVYYATLESVDEDEGQYGPQLKCIFRITGPGKAAGQQIFGWCSPTLTPKSKLTAWLAALSPESRVVKGFVLDPADLVGAECQMVLGIKQGQDGQDRNVIESLLPLEAEAEEEEEEEPAPPPKRKLVATAATDESDLPF